MEKTEDGSKASQEDVAELSEVLKQFIRAVAPTHPALEVWDDREERTRVCREMPLRSSE